MQTTIWALLACVFLVMPHTTTALSPAPSTTPPPPPPFALDRNNGAFLFAPDGTWRGNGTHGVDQQQLVDKIFVLQVTAQFSESRFALMFLPGVYKLNIRVGYYTQLLGLGAVPDDVVIRGGVSVPNQGTGNSPGALDTFWRGAENLRVEVLGDRQMYWAVSQACPLRRVHVVGDLNFAKAPGWSSGGFLADSIIDGTCRGITQQQWAVRNTHCTYSVIDYFASFLSTSPSLSSFYFALSFS
jgi:hypothetical protein